MKKLAFTLTMILLAMIYSAFSQVISDAGSDRVVCAGIHPMDTITIGGSPAAMGGKPPYTYTWETDYIWNIGDFASQNFTASDFLNDTTIANPKIIHAIGDTIHFRLTVTDSENNIAIDTTTVYYAYFGSHLGYAEYTIDQGDSVFLQGWQNVFGGFPPYEYIWRPNHGLSDSTSLAFWAKPDHSVAYYMTLKDSAGCVVTGAPVYYVNVQPLNVGEFENQNSMAAIYPNPVSDHLNVSIDQRVQGEFTLRLFFSNGKLIEEKRFQENEFTIDLLSYPPGIYVYEIIDNKGFSEQGRIMKK